MNNKHIDHWQNKKKKPALAIERVVVFVYSKQLF